MIKMKILFLGLFFILLSPLAGATSCPDPKTTSLQWGVPPEPWIENPLSPNSPQGEDNTQFVRANIIVAGYGRGVTCTYLNSVGEYSILWSTFTKIPAREDYNWISFPGGFVCSVGLNECEFFTAK